MSDKTIKRSENMSKAVVYCSQMLHPFITILLLTFLEILDGNCQTRKSLLVPIIALVVLGSGSYIILFDIYLMHFKFNNRKRRSC